MKIDKGIVRKKSEDYKSELLDFLKLLVQTPSINGKDPERNIAELIAKEAKKLDLSSKLIAADENRPNIFIGEGFDKKSGLLLVAHLDTVPSGDENKWRHKPFGGEIERGKLFGRGGN